MALHRESDRLPGRRDVVSRRPPTYMTAETLQIIIFSRGHTVEALNDHHRLSWHAYSGKNPCTLEPTVNQTRDASWTSDRT